MIPEPSPLPVLLEPTEPGDIDAALRVLIQIAERIVRERMLQSESAPPTTEEAL